MITDRAVDYLVGPGTSRAKVVAVGDDGDDLPLLNRAGHAAAVGNAASVVKRTGAGPVAN